MRPSHRSVAAFTLIELLVVLAIIGTLVALLLPAVQKVREVAARTKCQNNLKQIAIALHLYHDAYLTLPPGVIVPGQEGNPCPYAGYNPSGPPWTVLILPFLEETGRYDQFNVKTGTYFGLYTPPVLDHTVYTEMPHQIEPCRRFECPVHPLSGNDSPNNTYFGVMGGATSPTDTGCCTNHDGYVPNRYGSNTGVMWNGSHVRLTDVSDGTSNTLMVGETRYLNVYPGVGGYYGGTWASGYYFGGGAMAIGLAVTFQPINSSNLDPRVNGTDNVLTTTFGSYHRYGANFATCDAAVLFVTENIDLALYQSLGKRADGLPEGGWPP